MGELTVAQAFDSIQILFVALLFNLMLYVILMFQGRRGMLQHGAFTNVVLAAFCANLMTCVQVFFTHADVGTPAWLVDVLKACALMSNTLVCFYFAVYVTHHYDRKEHSGEKVPRFNILMVVIEGMLLAGWLAYALPLTFRTGEPVMITGFFYIITGFIMELYHLVYCLVVFIRKRDVLDSDARLVVLCALGVTVSTIIMQWFLGDSPMINYLGATIGMFIFYFNAETPDYIALHKTLEELTVERKRAEAANEAKSGFLANMSHEMRTPLSAVLGMNEMILRESRDEEITGYARSVERAGKSLLAVINDVLDFSRIESGKLQIVSAPYSLSGVLSDVHNMMLFRAEQNRLQFIVDVDPEIPDLLTGDEVRIRQIMTNLLNNAIKYTREGSVTLVVGYEDTPPMMNLIFSVKDTGIGIRPEDMEKLFGKFERLDMEENNSIEGAGLGLAITHELVTLMGGEITAKSSYGEGSVFTVSIPQGVEDPTPVGDFRETFRRSEGEREAYRALFTAPDAKVLVVDDTVVNLTVFRKLLGRTRMVIDTATGGLDALSLTQDIQYDLIFMDQRMPGMDGTKTLSHIRSQADGVNKGTPVICLTADAVAGAKDRYVALGFTDYLTKPIEADKLERMVMRYLTPEKVLVGGDEGVSTGTVLGDTFSGKSVGHGDRFLSQGDRFLDSLAERVKEPVPLTQEPVPVTRVPVTHGSAAGARENVSERTVPVDTPAATRSPAATPTAPLVPDEKTLHGVYESSGLFSFRSAIKNCVDAETLYVILQEYYADIPEKTKLLEEYAAAGDIENYTIRVHGLKSASRMIGALDFAETAYRMEQAGEAEDIDTIREQTPALIEEYHEIRDALAPLM